MDKSVEHEMEIGIIQRLMWFRAGLGKSMQPGTLRLTLQRRSAGLGRVGICRHGLLPGS